MESVLKLTRALFQYQKLIKSKNVVVIDDSIVRGTSSQSIIKILRSSGASKITLIVTFPTNKISMLCRN